MPLPYSNTRVTLELRDLINSLDENGQPFNLWDFDYPSFYEGDAKKAFEQKVIDHYYFRQIGSETAARFKHNFKTRMCEIMPYYVQLYESEKFMREIDDPFATVDFTETYEETATGNAQSSTTGTETGTATGSESATKHSQDITTEVRERRMSDTPHGEIENLNSYLTKGERENNEITVEGDETSSGTSENESTISSNGSASATSNNTVKHTLTKKGAMGVTTFGHDMIEYRQSFLNIDKMVIDDLNNLFLMVY